MLSTICEAEDQLHSAWDAAQSGCDGHQQWTACTTLAVFRSKQAHNVKAARHIRQLPAVMAGPCPQILEAAAVRATLAEPKPQQAAP